ncbi:MAG: hypothetical protein KME35_21025 [Aphanocapsa sp. GSE-SYN-MK-11-07L]|jgi:hypothetical protein|nr:hypothetical protein [Aphanocapsa sp. GSE-SYN-MK-11-07L]
MSYIESNIADQPSTVLNWHQGWETIATSRLWFFLLVGLGTMSNVVYTCTVPLVGFGAIAGSTLIRRRAIATAMTMWLVNQMLGFTLHHYPLTLSTFAWGFVLGLGTLLVTLLASMNPPFAQNQTIGHYQWLGIAFAVGFILYELVIWLAGLALGGGEGFTLPILGGILMGNAVWAIALSSIHALWVWGVVKHSVLPSRLSTNPVK